MTLPSPILSFRSRIRRVRDTRQPVHVLHVGKTGGTALKHALIEHQETARYRLVFRGHEVGLAGVPVGERFMFLIRDPLSRFVSAFNGRLREDRPRYLPLPVAGGGAGRVRDLQDAGSAGNGALVR